MPHTVGAISLPRELFWSYLNYGHIFRSYTYFQKKFLKKLGAVVMKYNLQGFSQEVASELNIDGIDYTF